MASSFRRFVEKENITLAVDQDRPLHLNNSFDGDDKDRLALTTKVRNPDCLELDTDFGTESGHLMFEEKKDFPIEYVTSLPVPYLTQSLTLPLKNPKSVKERLKVDYVKEVQVAKFNELKTAMSESYENLMKQPVHLGRIHLEKCYTGAFVGLYKNIFNKKNDQKIQPWKWNNFIDVAILANYLFPITYDVLKIPRINIAIQNRPVANSGLFPNPVTTQPEDIVAQQFSNLEYFIQNNPATTTPDEKATLNSLTIARDKVLHIQQAAVEAEKKVAATRDSVADGEYYTACVDAIKACEDAVQACIHEISNIVGDPSIEKYADMAALQTERKTKMKIIKDYWPDNPNLPRTVFQDHLIDQYEPDYGSRKIAYDMALHKLLFAEVPTDKTNIKEITPRRLHHIGYFDTDKGLSDAAKYIETDDVENVMSLDILSLYENMDVYLNGMSKGSSDDVVKFTRQLTKLIISKKGEYEDSSADIREFSNLDQNNHKIWDNAKTLAGAGDPTDEQIDDNLKNRSEERYNYYSNKAKALIELKNDKKDLVPKFINHEMSVRMWNEHNDNYNRNKVFYNTQLNLALEPLYELECFLNSDQPRRIVVPIHLLTIANSLIHGMIHEQTQYDLIVGQYGLIDKKAAALQKLQDIYNQNYGLKTDKGMPEDLNNLFDTDKKDIFKDFVKKFNANNSTKENAELIQNITPADVTKLLQDFKTNATKVIGEMEDNNLYHYSDYPLQLGNPLKVSSDLNEFKTFLNSIVQNIDDNTTLKTLTPDKGVVDAELAYCVHLERFKYFLPDLFNTHPKPLPLAVKKASTCNTPTQIGIPIIFLELFAIDITQETFDAYIEMAEERRKYIYDLDNRIAKTKENVDKRDYEIENIVKNRKGKPLTKEEVIDEIKEQKKKGVALIAELILIVNLNPPPGQKVLNDDLVDTFVNDNDNFAFTELKNNFVVNSILKDNTIRPLLYLICTFFNFFPKEHDWIPAFTCVVNKRILKILNTHRDQIQALLPPTLDIVRVYSVLSHGRFLIALNNAVKKEDKTSEGSFMANLKAVRELSYLEGPAEQANLRPFCSLLENSAAAAVGDKIHFSHRMILDKVETAKATLAGKSLKEPITYSKFKEKEIFAYNELKRDIDPIHVEAGNNTECADLFRLWKLLEFQEGIYYVIEKCITNAKPEGKASKFINDAMGYVEVHVTNVVDILSDTKKVIEELEKFYNENDVLKNNIEIRCVYLDNSTFIVTRQPLAKATVAAAAPPTPLNTIDPTVNNVSFCQWLKYNAITLFYKSVCNHVSFGKSIWLDFTELTLPGAPAAPAAPGASPRPTSKQINDLVKERRNRAIFKLLSWLTVYDHYDSVKIVLEAIDVYDGELRSDLIKRYNHKVNAVLYEKVVGAYDPTTTPARAKVWIDAAFNGLINTAIPQDGTSFQQVFLLREYHHKHKLSKDIMKEVFSYMSYDIMRTVLGSTVSDADRKEADKEYKLYKLLRIFYGILPMLAYFIGCDTEANFNYSYLEDFIAKGVNVAFNKSWKVSDIEQEGGGAGDAVEDEAILKEFEKGAEEEFGKLQKLPLPEDVQLNAEEVAKQSDKALDNDREQREDERKAIEEEAKEVFGKLQYEEQLNTNKVILASPAINTEKGDVDIKIDEAGTSSSDTKRTDEQTSPAINTGKGEVDIKIDEAGTSSSDTKRTDKQTEHHQHKDLSKTKTVIVEKCKELQKQADKNKYESKLYEDIIDRYGNDDARINSYEAEDLETTLEMIESQKAEERRLANQSSRQEGGASSEMRGGAPAPLQQFPCLTMTEIFFDESNRFKKGKKWYDITNENLFRICGYCHLNKPITQEILKGDNIPTWLSCTESRKENVLHTAAYSNNREFFNKINGIDKITKVYQRNGGEINYKVSLRPTHHRNPLHYAKTGEMAEAILKLYKSDKQDKIGEHDIWGFTPLHYASYLGLYDVVDAMLEHVPTYSKNVNYFKTIFLHREGLSECKKNQLQIGMDEKYVVNSALLSLRNLRTARATPVHLAVIHQSEGHWRTLELFLSKKADRRIHIDIGDSHFRTPLAYASAAGNYKAVKVLLQNGVNPEGVNFTDGERLDYGNTTLGKDQRPKSQYINIATPATSLFFYKTALWCAVNYAYTKVKILRTDDGKYPPHFRTAQLLISYGATIEHCTAGPPWKSPYQANNIYDKYPSTPYYWAQKHEKTWLQPRFTTLFLNHDIQVPYTAPPAAGQGPPEYQEFRSNLITRGHFSAGDDAIDKSVRDLDKTPVRATLDTTSLTTATLLGFNTFNGNSDKKMMLLLAVVENSERNASPLMHSILMGELFRILVPQPAAPPPPAININHAVSGATLITKNANEVYNEINELYNGFTGELEIYKKVLSEGKPDGVVKQALKLLRAKYNALTKLRDAHNDVRNTKYLGESGFLASNSLGDYRKWLSWVRDTLQIDKYKTKVNEVFNEISDQVDKLNNKGESTSEDDLEKNAGKLLQHMAVRKIMNQLQHMVLSPPPSFKDIESKEHMKPRSRTFEVMLYNYELPNADTNQSVKTKKEIDIREFFKRVGCINEFLKYMEENNKDMDGGVLVGGDGSAVVRFGELVGGAFSSDLSKLQCLFSDELIRLTEKHTLNMSDLFDKASNVGEEKSNYHNLLEVCLRTLEIQNKNLSTEEIEKGGFGNRGRRDAWFRRNGRMLDMIYEIRGYMYKDDVYRKLYDDTINNSANLLRFVSIFADEENKTKKEEGETMMCQPDVFLEKSILDQEAEIGKRGNLPEIFLYKKRAELYNAMENDKGSNTSFASNYIFEKLGRSNRVKIRNFEKVRDELRSFNFAAMSTFSTNFLCTALLVSMLNIMTDGGDFTLMINMDGKAVQEVKDGHTKMYDMNNWFYGKPEANGERGDGAIDYLGHFLDARKQYLDELYKANLYKRSNIHPGDSVRATIANLELRRVGIVKQHLEKKKEIEELNLKLEKKRDELNKCYDTRRTRRQCDELEKDVQDLEDKIKEAKEEDADLVKQMGDDDLKLKDKYVEMDKIEKGEDADEEMSRVWAEAKVEEARSKLLKEEKEKELSEVEAKLANVGLEIKNNRVRLGIAQKRHEACLRKNSGKGGDPCMDFRKVVENLEKKLMGLDDKKDLLEARKKQLTNEIRKHEADLADARRMASELDNKKRKDLKEKIEEEKRDKDAKAEKAEKDGEVRQIDGVSFYRSDELEKVMDAYLNDTGDWKEGYKVVAGRRFESKQEMFDFLMYHLSPELLTEQMVRLFQGHTNEGFLDDDVLNKRLEKDELRKRHKYERPPPEEGKGSSEDLGVIQTNISNILQRQKNSDSTMSKIQKKLDTLEPGGFVKPGTRKNDPTPPVWGLDPIVLLLAMGKKKHSGGGTRKRERGGGGEGPGALKMRDLVGGSARRRRSVRRSGGSAPYTYKMSGGNIVKVFLSGGTNPGITTTDKKTVRREIKKMLDKMGSYVDDLMGEDENEEERMYGNRLRAKDKVNRVFRERYRKLLQLLRYSLRLHKNRVAPGYLVDQYRMVEAMHNIAQIQFKSSMEPEEKKGDDGEEGKAKVGSLPVSSVGGSYRDYKYGDDDDDDVYNDDDVDFWDMLKINNLPAGSLRGYLEDMSLPYDVEELNRRYECLVGRRRGVFDGFKSSGADGYGYGADGYGYSADGYGYGADGYGYSADGYGGVGESCGLDALASLAAMEYGKRRGRR